MKTLPLMLLFVFVFQQTAEIEFFCNGKFYQFVLPAESYEVSTKSYTEGTFTTYKYGSGERIVLHVGDNVVKPFLKRKKYKEIETTTTEFGVIRKGIDKETDLFWQEYTSIDGLITVYFTNVTENRLLQFEESLKTLHVSRKVK